VLVSRKALELTHADAKRVALGQSAPQFRGATTVGERPKRKTNGARNEEHRD
jgi:hypothetical protein